MPTPANLDALRIDRSDARPQRRARRRRWPRRVALLLLLAAAVWFFRRPLVELVDRLRLPRVRVARAIERSPVAAGALLGAAANGYVVARVSAALSADTPGRLVELNVVEGSRVKAGEVVARLYYDELQAAFERAWADVLFAEASVTRARAELESAQHALEALRAGVQAAEADVEALEADLVFAEKEEQRALELVAEGHATQSRADETRRALDASKARLEASRARLATTRASVAEGESRVAVATAAVLEGEAGVAVRDASRAQAEATLEKTYVRAPFDGIVVRKDAEVGEVVSPSSQGGSSLTRGSVVTMVDLASLEVQAEVPETTLAAVAVGAPARIFLDAFPGEPYAGRIDRIWPIADRQKATIEVRVAFEDMDERRRAMLRPEMSVRVVFLDEEPDEESTPGGAPLVTIPSAARVRVAGKDGAFVLERDVVRFLELALGEERAGRIVVQRGLKGGETVVLDPPPDLADGDRVIAES